MNIPLLSRLNRLVRLSLCCAGALLFLIPVARAGLTMQMQLVHYSYAGNYYYYFFPYLSTNTTAPILPFGDYFVAAPGFPTNGATAQYHFDTNGFNQVGGGAGGFNNFDAPDFNDSFIKSLTQGNWSIFVTNTVTTNLYHFTVTANIDSNSLPPVVITFPPYGATDVTNQPTITWQGPTNYSDLIIYEYDQSPYLPVTQTSFLSSVLYQGTNDVTVHYDSNSTTAVVCSIPRDAGSNAISSWVSTCVLQTYFDSQFTVGAVGPSSTGHTNVAFWNFDADTIYAADVTGHGNNINSASYFSVLPYITNDAAAGPYGVGFGGGGWLNPPTNLVAALSGSFSVSLWVRTTDDPGNDTDTGDAGAGLVAANTDQTVPVALTGSKLAFLTGGTPPDTLHSATSINTGQYVHAVVTRDQGTGEKKIYINGALDATDYGTAGSLPTQSSPQLFIGENTSFANGLIGDMDQIQIYTGVLSTSDVTFLYLNPGTNVADSAGSNTDFNTALNTTNLVWVTSGDTDWFVESTNTQDGVLAAQSGVVTNSQSSTLTVTVTGPGTLTFYWSCQGSGNGNFDYEFYMDGDPNNNDLDDLYSSIPWYQAGLDAPNGSSFVIPAGQHTLSWTVFANGDNDPTEAGFLDVVSYVPTIVSPAPVITLNPFDQTNYPGYDVALLAAVSTNSGAVNWAWYKTGSGTPIANATNALFIPTNSGNASVAGSYYAVATNSSGSATSTTATVSFVTAPLPPDWSLAFSTPFSNNDSDATTNYNIAMLLDSTGNVYTVGSLIGTNFFGTNTLISANGVFESSFLKQSTSGTAIWGLAMTNNGNGSSYAECIAAAPGNGFYVAGVFSGTNWLGTNKLVDVAGYSTYVARFDANGNVLWLRTIVGTNANFAEYHELVSDPAGNATLSLLISGGTSFGTTNIYLPGQQGVLVQYDANGNIRWLEVPSNWPEYLTYSAGCIYGGMGGNSTNYIGGATNVSDRQRALFSINATNGQGNWVRGIGAPLGQGNPYGLVDDNALVAVSGTNVFVVGSAWGSNASFGPFTVTFPAAKGQYFARYDTNGNAQLATTFGSQYTTPWTVVADASGNVYVGADFDTYSIFGQDIIAAPFYATIQYVGPISDRIPGQTCVAKFDRNGNALWVRRAESLSSDLNSRDLVLASDGVWSPGFNNQQSEFGTHTIFGAFTCIGFPTCTLTYDPSGYLAKITETVALSPITLINPGTSGANFQFSFQSESGYNYNVLTRTNLILGAWQTNGTISGDGTIKLYSIPKTNSQRYFRVEAN